LEKRDVWSGEFPAGEGGHPIKANDNEYHYDTSGEDERFDERNIRWDEAWMSFRAEGTEAESALFAGAHMPSGPDRRVSLELQLIYSRLDPLIEWGVLVQLEVSNERYEAENPATLDLLFPSCSVHEESDVASSLKGLKCDLLTDAPAVQFSERFTCHPTFENSKKRSNLVLIEFNSARAFIKAPNSRSAAEKELLGMSTELNQHGPALSDALDAFRATASLAGHVQIVAHMTEKQHAQDEDRVRDG